MTVAAAFCARCSTGYDVALGFCPLCGQTIACPPAAKKGRRPSSMRNRRRRLIARDGSYCQRCGRVDRLTVDHVIPISRGGSNNIENLQLLCESCNQAKGATMPTTGERTTA